MWLWEEYCIPHIPLSNAIYVFPLVVQWLGLHTPLQGARGWTLGWETIHHTAS